MTEELKEKDVNMSKIDEKIRAEEKSAGGIRSLIKKFGFPLLLVGILVYQVGIYVYNHNAVEDAWDPNEWEDMPPVYPTEMVMRQTLEDTIYAKGNLETEDEGELKSKASGRLEALYVKEGDYVTEGQTIGRIDSREFMLRYERAKLALDRDLLKAEKDKLDREKDQGKYGASALYSDIAGQVTDFSLKAGDKITAGQVIGQVNPYDKLEVVGGFHHNQTTQMRIGDAVDVFLPEFLSTKEAKIIEIGQVPIAVGTGMVKYEVIAELTNPGGLTEASQVQMIVRKGNQQMVAMDKGKLQKPKPLELKSEVNGVVLEALVKPGDIISVGTKVISLDTSGYAIEESEQIIADKERDFALREQRLSLLEMENEMKHFTIVAEESGLISELHVKQGDQVSAQMKLASLATETLVVKAKVDELDISKVYLGQEARIESDAYRDEIFVGEVVKIADKATPKGSGAEFDVTIKLVDAGNLKAGMSVYIDIIIDELVDALVIPKEYVEYEGEETYVWVVQNTEYGGQTTDQNIDNNIDEAEFVDGFKAEFTEGEIGDMNLLPVEAGPVEFEEPEAVRTLVVLGKEIDGKVEVLEGLNEGDIIENRSGGAMNDWGGGMDYWGGGGMMPMPMGGGMIMY